ncbi:Nuclear control of ATPase protein 2 [Balamuthia mandrillaris]
MFATKAERNRRHLDSLFAGYAWIEQQRGTVQLPPPPSPSQSSEGASSSSQQVLSSEEQKKLSEALAFFAALRKESAFTNNNNGNNNAHNNTQEEDTSLTALLSSKAFFLRLEDLLSELRSFFFKSSPDESEAAAEDEVLKDAQRYLLALSAIAFNQCLGQCLLPLALRMSSDLSGWREREEAADRSSSYWYLYEKTPFFWLRYGWFWLQRNVHASEEEEDDDEGMEGSRNVAQRLWFGWRKEERHKEGEERRRRGGRRQRERRGEKRPVMLHPSQELRRNVLHLSMLEKNVLTLLGVVARAMSRYDIAPSKASLSPLIYANHSLLAQFFELPQLLQLDSPSSEMPKGIAGFFSSFSSSYSTYSPTSFHRDWMDDWNKNLGEDIFQDIYSFDENNEEQEHEEQEINGTSTPIIDAYSIMLANCRATYTMFQDLEQLSRRYARPSRLSAHWMKYTAITAGISGLVWSVMYNRVTIMESIQALQVTSVNLLKNWVVRPLQDVYRTVRYNRHSFVIMSDAAMAAEAQSLRRMVEEFITQSKLARQEMHIQNIIHQVDEGDLSAIMPLYEKEIQSPLVNAMFGHLLQLMLIQVQKLKVDVSRTMLVLDKLMRSNELNFQLLAITPVLLLLGTFLTTVYRRITHINLRRNIHSHLRRKLRDLERLLTLNLHHHHHPLLLPQQQNQQIQHTEKGKEKEKEKEKQTRGGDRGPTFLGFEESGRLILDVNDMLNAASQLRERGEQRLLFLEDLHDLEAEGLSVHQKLATIQRMHHTFAFLHPLFTS